MGPDYHWVVDVLTRMGLPVFSGVPAILKMLNNKRHKILENQKTKLGRLKRKRYLKRRKVYDRKKREAWTKTAGKGHDYHGADDETPKGKSRLGGEMRPPKKVRKSCDSFAGDNIACNKVGDESETLVSEYYMYSTDSDSERTPRGPKGKSRLGGERRPWKNVRKSCDSVTGDNIACNITNKVGDESETVVSEYYSTGSDSEHSFFDVKKHRKSRPEICSRE